MSKQFGEKPPTLKKLTTPESRMEEFAQTGDPSVLTIEEAMSMGLGLDMMSQVYGVTDEALKAAALVDVERIAEGRAYDNEVLAKFGVQKDVFLNFEKRPQEDKIKTLRSLIEVFCIVPESEEERVGLQHAKDLIRVGIPEIIKESTENIIFLFSAVSPDSPNALIEVQILRKLLGWIQNAFKEETQTGNHQLVINLLNDLYHVCDQVLRYDFVEHANAFAVTELKRIAQDYSGENFPAVDEDNFYPFPIFPGTYGYFSADGRRIYLSYPELSERISSEFRSKGAEIETYSNIRRNFGGMGHNEDLAHLGDEMVDYGLTLEDYYKSLGVNDLARINALADFLHSSYRIFLMKPMWKDWE